MQNRILGKSLYLFSVFMIFVYLGFAIFLFISEDLSWIENDKRNIFAGVLVAYSTFKIFRAYQQRHIFNNEDNES